MTHVHSQSVTVSVNVVNLRKADIRQLPTITLYQETLGQVTPICVFDGKVRSGDYWMMLATYDGEIGVIGLRFLPQATFKREDAKFWWMGKEVPFALIR